MHKRDLLIIALAIIIVFGVMLLPKYFEYRNSLKQEVVDILPPQKLLTENFSLPPPATSTAIKTTILPKPILPLQQQEVTKKISLPPPPIQ